jgi:hypothetical protein
MEVPFLYHDKITQEKLDEWYDDAITNCYEQMEDPSEEEAHNWAEFCVTERLKHTFDLED